MNLLYDINMLLLKRKVYFLLLLIYLYFCFIINKNEGECSAEIDDNTSLLYGTATGKGEVIHPAKSHTSIPIKRKTIIENSMPKKTLHTKHVAYKVENNNEESNLKLLCLEPHMIGIPTIQTCENLKNGGRAYDRNIISIQRGLENYEFVTDYTCDDGSGEGYRNYQSRLGNNIMGISINVSPSVGKCLGIDRSVLDIVSIGIPVGDGYTIICCRVIPKITTTTTTTATTTTTTATTTTTTTISTTTTTSSTTSTSTFAMMNMPVTRTTTVEALLPLSSTMSNNLPPVTPSIHSSRSNNIPIITTPSPSIMSSSPTTHVNDEMCVLPKYLGLPRVNNCEELRDVALSTNYVELLNLKIADCAWMDDNTCKPNYPGLGAYLDGGVAHNACLAFRQTICGNIINTYPILGKHVKNGCSSSSHSKGNNLNTNMHYMMMPIPTSFSNSKGGNMHRRRLYYVDNIFSINKLYRRLHGNNVAPSKESKGHSDSIVLCCRLDCENVYNMRYSRTSNTNTNINNNINRNNNNNNNNEDRFGYNTNTRNEDRRRYNNNIQNIGRGTSLGDILTERDTMTNDNIFPRSTAAASSMNRSDLCNPRFWQICYLATPLRGEQIIFDQRCMEENLPGCYAGGMPCCRSVGYYDN